MIEAKDLIPSSIGDKKANRLATVTALSGGRPLVTIDGETNQRTKLYPYASGLTFAVGDRVFLQAVGNSYVIAYKIVN
jgi:hypothetical protein